ncbi:hypothetical protein V865_006761 [Kwoniella europaea PYCC6329]|uniref:Uncharacterized protein n=1 Tax=Kwoniella europaea PYCC6329 TaxID=1423913 RepID=A0AAX4KTN0_9TREE
MSSARLYRVKYIKGDNEERSFDLTEGSVLNICGDRWTPSNEREGGKLQFISENSTYSISRVFTGQTFASPRYEAVVVAARPEGSEDAVSY